MTTIPEDIAEKIKEVILWLPVAEIEAEKKEIIKKHLMAAMVELNAKEEKKNEM